MNSSNTFSRNNPAILFNRRFRGPKYLAFYCSRASRRKRRLTTGRYGSIQQMGPTHTRHRQHRDIYNLNSKLLLTKIKLKTQKRRVMVTSIRQCSSHRFPTPSVFYLCASSKLRVSRFIIRVPCLRRKGIFYFFELQPVPTASTPVNSTHFRFIPDHRVGGKLQHSALSEDTNLDRVVV